MRHLILVKHARPEIVPAVPAAQWRLSDAGRQGSIALAVRLAAYRPAAVVASAEPKAAETAEIMARRLGLPAVIAEGLHEHDRSGVGWQAAGAFEAAVERFFARPAELVFGRETAHAAQQRFIQAVERALDAHPSGTLAIVAHGTVISLFVAARAGVEPLPLWRRLGLPAFVVLALPEMAIVEVVERVAL